MEWNGAFGGDSLDMAYSVRQTSDGGYIIAGETMSYGAGDADFWLVKTANAITQATTHTQARVDTSSLTYQVFIIGTLAIAGLDIIFIARALKRRRSGQIE
jgi:hypothetical protein